MKRLSRASAPPPIAGARTKKLGTAGPSAQGPPALVARAARRFPITHYHGHFEFAETVLRIRSEIGLRRVAARSVRVWAARRADHGNGREARTAAIAKVFRGPGSG